MRIILFVSISFSITSKSDRDVSHMHEGRAFHVCACSMLPFDPSISILCTAHTACSLLLRLTVSSSFHALLFDLFLFIAVSVERLFLSLSYWTCLYGNVKRSARKFGLFFCRPWPLDYFLFCSPRCQVKNRNSKCAVWTTCELFWRTNLLLALCRVREFNDILYMGRGPYDRQ